MIQESDPANPQAIAPKLQTNRTVSTKWKNDLIFTLAFVVCFLVFLGLSGNLVSSKNAFMGGVSAGLISLPGPFPYPIAADDGSQRCKTECGSYDAGWQPCSLSAMGGGGSGRRLSDAEAHEEYRRRLQEDDSNWNAWRVFSEAPEMATMVAVVIAIGVAWVIALEKCSRPLIYATALLKPCIFVLLGVWMLNNGVESTIPLIQFACAALSLAMFLYFRSQYDLSAKIMTTSCEMLGDNKGVWGVCFALKGVYLAILFFYTYVSTQSFYVWQWRFHPQSQGEMVGPWNGPGTCILAPADWAKNHSVFLSVTFLWITYWFCFARLVVVATSVANWYFHGDAPVLGSPALTGAKWALTTSSGVVAYSALIMTVVEQIKRSASGRCWWTNPWGCTFKIIFCVLSSCIEALSTFAVIVHVVTAGSFCESVAKTYHLIKKRFMGALIVDQAGSDCLKLGAYVFSVALFFITWAWADKVVFGEAPGTMSGVTGQNTIMYIMIVLGIIFCNYPMGGIFLVSYISSMDAINEQFGKYIAPPMCGIFIGCVSHIIFAAMAEVLLHTIDSVFICYSIEKDAGARQQQRFQGENGLYVVLASTPAMAKFDEAQNVAGTTTTGIVTAQPASLPMHNQL